LFAGSILKQSGVPFDVGSLNGINIIALQGKTGTPGTSQVQIGLLTPAGNGTFTFATDQNSAGVITSNPAVSGTYTVAGNGRVTVAGAGSNPPFLYLVTNNTGFVVGTDTSVTTGFFEPQVGSAFTNASISGNFTFGDMAPVVSTSSLSSGVVSPNGLTPGALAGTSDQNSSGSLSAGQAFTASYTVAPSGRATITSTGDTNVMYIISTSKAVVISTNTTTTGPTILVIEK
jgi:hypothetical protein